ncbi:MAG: type II toxin-antitoxin system HicB family antitoxin [Gemmatimonadetes bacterium]|nr:type II toxin-antitoxin system HicB family antitoxin [Gemmatimonadota bacterium]
MRYLYPCILTPEKEGGFFVSFPDVPGALTCGDDRIEALEMAEDALVAMLAVYVHQQREIPTPSPVADDQELVAVPPIAAAKLALYTAMREQGITGDALAVRLNLSDSAIRKLLDPDCYSHISQIMKALRNVGRSLVIEDRAA